MGINPADGEISEDISQDFTYNAQDYIEDAEQGDTAAQFILAECYKDGKGIEQDYAKALEWYKKALNANTNEDEKQTTFFAAVYKDIAECYQNLKENKKSIEYLKKAQSIYESMADPDTRLNWIQKAADDGLIEAQEDIDKLKKEGKQ